jgi:hypothetical protein
LSRRKRRESSYDFDDEKPWTEAQWEAFMKESDLRSARFGDLLETLRDDPDCHEKVAREMGWVEVDEDNEDTELAAEREQWIDEMNAAGEEALKELESERAADAAAGITPAQRHEMDHDAEKRAYPAYGAACDLSEQIIELFKPLDRQQAGEAANAGEDGPPLTNEQEAEAELMNDAFIGMMTASAKMAGAMGMEEEERTLCCAIVRYRIALESAARGRAAWEKVSARGGRPFTAGAAEQMLNEHRRVEQIIAEQIAAMRERVWW